MDGYHLNSSSTQMPFWLPCCRLTSSNESYSATGRFLIFGSKHRYSGRTEKQAQADGTNRPPPKVVRTPSKRHQRRSSADSLPNGNIHLFTCL